MENQVLDNDLTFNKSDEFSNYQLRSNEQRAKSVLTLIWIVLGLEIISLISSGFQYDLLQTAANGGEITDQAATANDLREQIIGVIYLIVYVASGIFFIMWFRRAYYNLHQMVKGLSFTEGWAAGSWFVPLVNFYRPYQIMKELYEETKKLLLSKNILSEFDLTTNLIGIWWLIWLGNGIFGRVIFRMSRDADTIPELISITTLTIVNGAIGIVLAIITVKVIKDYSKVEGLLVSNE